MMIYHARKEGPWDGQLSSSYYTDDPLLSRLYEVETFESLLDMAVSERNRCEREACDVVFLDLTVNLFSTMVTGMYTVRHEGHPDLNSLIKTSRADDIITLTQDAADRLRGTAQHNFMDMQAHLIRSLLTGDYEGLEDKLFRHLPMMAEEAERALARLDDTEDKGRRLGLAEESESDATKAFHAMRDDYALSTPAGGLSDNPAIDPKGTLGYGSKFHTACTGLTSPAEAIEAVRVALDSGVDVNSKNRDYTCLHIAVFHAIPALVDFLLAAGAEVDAVAHGHTPLHFAAYAAPEESIMVSHKGPKLRNSRKKWVPELDRAYANITRQLVAAGADVDAPIPGLVHSEDATVRALHVASRGGFSKIVAELIAGGADVNAVDSYGITPLNWAMHIMDDFPTTVHTDIVKALLAAGAEPNAKVDTENLGGWSLFHAAAHLGNLEVVDALLRAGARVDKQRHNGATALYDAAHEGHDRVVDRLIEAGADSSKGAKGAGTGQSIVLTPLTAATLGGYLRVVRSLIRGGVDVNQAGYGGETSLFSAVRKGKKDIIKLLLESGARTDVRANAAAHRASLERWSGMKVTGDDEYGLMDLTMDESTRAFLEDHFRSTENRVLLKRVLAAVLVVAVIAIGVWKSRAPAHERAARELLDDLAPSARTRRGRVVPVWATLLRIAVCCACLIYSVLLSNDPDEGGMASFIWNTVVHFYLCRNGVWTLSERFAPEGSIWGRVGADALTLLQLIFGDTEFGSTFETILTCLSVSLWLLGMGRLAYDGVGWLRRFVQNSGPGAGRAPQTDERPSTGAPASQQRGARPGLRKRANRGRRREATPRAPQPDPPETKSEPAPAAKLETLAPEPKAPEPEPEPEPTPAPVAEPRALSAAPVPESKVEEPIAPAPAALEAKLEEPAAVPEGFEIVARVLEHLNEPHLLPIFQAEEINDNVLPCLDPSDLIGLGVSQMTCLTILGAAHSAAKNKKLETEDVLDNVAKHQSVLEEALREHREEIKRLRIRELPEDLFAAASFQTRRGNAIDATLTAHRCCPITCEIMKDPVLCCEDGHTYERVAIEEWFAINNTSPATSQHLESTALAPNHVVRKLIAALLEQHRG